MHAQVGVLSQENPDQELFPSTNHCPWAKAVLDRTQRPLTTWGPSAGSPQFRRGQNVFEGVPRGTSYITMLLAEAVAPGPFCLEFWPLLHPALNMVPFLARQACTALIEASGLYRADHWFSHWPNSAGHLSWNCGQSWVTTHLPHTAQIFQYLSLLSRRKE